MTNFFKSIGNAFKAGWNNGNIAKGFKIAGASAMTVGVTAGMIDSMRNSSVFGNRCCHHGGGFGNFGGFGGNSCFSYMGGIDPYLMQNPMSILNSPFAQQSFGGMYSNNMYSGGMFSNMSMLNSMGTNMCDPGLFYQKYLAQMQQLQTMQLGNTPKNDNKYAGDVDADQDTTAGKNLDESLKGLVTGDGNALEGKSVKIADLSDVDEADLDAKYKEQISELGKSYIANIDKNGNSDGKVTVREYVKAQLAYLPSNATEEQKEEAEQAAINAFAILDQNGDGKFDWKEAAAMMRSFDRNSSKDVDGKIQSEDFARQSERLGAGATDDGAKLRLDLKSDYKALFGKD